MPRSRFFVITPAKAQDARRLVDIEFHAFEDEQVNQVLSYRDYKKATHFERSVKLYEIAMMNERDPARALKKKPRERTDSFFDKRSPIRLGTTFLKVVDTETNEPVSFAKVEMKKYGREELRSPASIGHEGEPKMNHDWFALNERVRREYVGSTEHCCKSDSRLMIGGRYAKDTN